MHESALDNFPTTDPVELYERQIEKLKIQLNRLNRENVSLQTRLAMADRDSRVKAELGQIKTEPRELHVSINLQF